MHILIIPSWYPTEKDPISGIFFKEQAKALKESGHKIGVLYPSRVSLRKYRIGDLLFKREFEDKDEAIITIRSQGWKLFPTIHHANASLLIRDGINLFKRYIKKYGRPDILHAHSILFGGVIGLEISKRFQIPFVVTEHSSAYLRGLIYPWQKTYLSKVFAKTERIIVVSPHLGTMLKKKYEAPSDLLQHIPNMVDTNFFTPVSKKKSNKFIFLTISILTKGKGQGILLEAIAKESCDDKDVYLCIGGDGEEKESLERKVEELNLQEKVKFLGALTRKEVREAIRDCDVFILPSFYETFGMVLIEALACGKPVIATRCGGPEYIVKEENGLLVTKGDVLELEEAMSKMKSAIKNFNSDAIRSDCINRFGRNAVILELNKLYSEIIDNS